MINKISQAVKHYCYDQDYSSSDERFLHRYNNFSDKETLRDSSYIVYGVLSGIPNSTHIKAKSLLFQGDNECWKYFERTAVFWTYGHLRDKWIDHLKGAYEYALYIERRDLVDRLIDISLCYLTDDSNLSNNEFKRQRVYPSTQLVHFLIEKWLGYNPAKELILKYGDGYGIYQKIIDNWEDFSKIEGEYWDELCEYHLNRIGLQQGEKWKNEEFLDSGLVPMELINLIKVRQKLGLDIPVINNPLFDTNMARMPIIPTGYNEKNDIIFVLVDLTVKTQRKYTIQEVEEYIKLTTDEKNIIW